MTPPQTQERRLRSDAAANRERVLAAAAAAVRHDGERVPMATIADAASVGIGTVYRHFPTREALLAALSYRAYGLVLDHARAAADADGPALDAIAGFLAQTIAARDDLILPLHGGPVLLDDQTLALRAEIRELLEQVLKRGRRDRSIRADATATDIIITGAMLAQPLAHVSDWDRLAQRQAEIYVAGLGTTPSSSRSRRRTSRAARSS
jgi:AcrR family transcriptional regulator